MPKVSVIVPVYNSEKEFINLGNYIKLDDENNVFIVKSADSNRKENVDLKPNKIRMF